MDGEQIEDRLEALERKLLKLVKEHRAVKQELQEAKAAKEGLEQLVAKQNVEIKNFQNKFKISKIVKSIASGTHETELVKHRIDEFIHEIDKCIAHLSE
jgi:flagellar motility protein MotE (MotC chaperone)